MDIGCGRYIVGEGTAGEDGKSCEEAYLTDHGLNQEYVTEEWDVHARKTI